MFLILLLSALGFAWQHGYVQQLGKYLKPVLVDKLHILKEQPAPPEGKKAAEPAAEKQAEPEKK